MTVNPDNIIAGPARVAVAVFGTPEPATATEALGVGWRDVGGTTGGVQYRVNRSTFELEVDQVPEPVGARITSRRPSIATTLAESTLENWAIALGELETAVVTAAGTSTLEPGNLDSASEPNYVAVCITGPAPEGGTRRVIVRKTLSTETIETANAKAAQSGIPVTFTGYRVSDSVKAFAFIDTAAA
jgi:hypothetical protein